MINNPQKMVICIQLVVYCIIIKIIIIRKNFHLYNNIINKYQNLIIILLQIMQMNNIIILLNKNYKILKTFINYNNKIKKIKAKNN